MSRRNGMIFSLIILTEKKMKLKNEKHEMSALTKYLLLNSIGDRVYLYVGLCSTYLPTYFLFVNADSLGLMVEKPHRNIRTFTKLHKYL